MTGGTDAKQGYSRSMTRGAAGPGLCPHAQKYKWIYCKHLDVKRKFRIDEYCSLLRCYNSIVIAARSLLHIRPPYNATMLHHAAPRENKP